MLPNNVIASKPTILIGRHLTSNQVRGKNNKQIIYKRKTESTYIGYTNDTKI